MARDGRAHFNSVSSAIEHAPEGSELRIHPGRYDEPGILIQKSIRLMGVGGAKATHLTITGDRYGIYVNGCQVEIEGLSVESASSFRAGETPMIYLQVGSLVLNSCNILNHSSSTVTVMVLGNYQSETGDYLQSGCRLQMSNTTLTGGKAGIVVHTKTRANITECVVAGCESGVISSGRTTILRTILQDIQNNALAALWKEDGQNETMLFADQCKVLRCGVGFYSDNAIFEIVRSTIESCKYGVNTQSSKGRVEECLVAGNKVYGIHLENGYLSKDRGPVTVKCCRITQNNIGINITNEVIAFVESCDLLGNKIGSWERGSKRPGRNNKEQNASAMDYVRQLMSSE